MEKMDNEQVRKAAFESARKVAGLSASAWDAVEAQDYVKAASYYNEIQVVSQMLATAFITIALAKSREDEPG